MDRPVSSSAEIVDLEAYKQRKSLAAGPLGEVVDCPRELERAQAVLDRLFEAQSHLKFAKDLAEEAKNMSEQLQATIEATPHRRMIVSVPAGSEVFYGAKSEALEEETKFVVDYFEPDSREDRPGIWFYDTRENTVFRAVGPTPTIENFVKD